VLRDVYGTEGLATRESATSIAQSVGALPYQSIEVDFSGIEHASIAFLDQLQHELVKTGKSISYVNVNDFVGHLLKVIERRRAAG
jgi:hypothetical protein